MWICNPDRSCRSISTLPAPTAVPAHFFEIWASFRRCYRCVKHRSRTYACLAANELLDIVLESRTVYFPLTTRDAVYQCKSGFGRLPRSIQSSASQLQGITGAPMNPMSRMWSIRLGSGGPLVECRWWSCMACGEGEGLRGTGGESIAMLRLFCKYPSGLRRPNGRIVAAPNPHRSQVAQPLQYSHWLSPVYILHLPLSLSTRDSVEFAEQF